MLKNQNKELVLLEDLGMLFATETSKLKARYGIYKCYCGNEFKTLTKSIRLGHTKSCGCLQKEKAHKLGKNNKTHGLTNHRLYNVWKNIIDRCTNENCERYKDYGARGITVCEEWLSIENFINDMYSSYKEGLSIDRENNNLGYSKENCRWTTSEIQARNTRVLRRDNKSGYRCVGWHKSSNKWMAYITINKKRKHLGLFDSAIVAAKAYDKYVTDNNLEHTKNF